MTILLSDFFRVPNVVLCMVIKCIQGQLCVKSRVIMYTDDQYTCTCILCSEQYLPVEFLVIRWWITPNHCFAVVKTSE